MAGKKRSGRASPTVAKAVDETQSQVAQLRDEGNKLFGRKEYAKALETYDKALKTVAPGSSDVALLHSNKAACHMMGKRYKDAVNECTAALEAQPNYHKALTRRSKAYEHMGLYKQALSDVQKSNKAGEATPESLEAEKRLKDILSGKRPNGAITTANGAPKSTGTQRRAGQPLLFSAKVELGEETRVLNLTGQATYSELLHVVKEKFPTSGPFALKYLDRENEWITITDRTDIQRALAELVEQAEKSSQGVAGKAPGAIPHLRLTAAKVSDESEVPKPPQEEEAAFRQIQMARKYLQDQAVKQQQQRQREQQRQLEQAQAEEQPGYELEQWIVDFASLFRDHTGIDPDKHLDLQSQGWEKLNKALEETVSDEKALPLFEDAANRFLEVTATGLMQMGNVYIALARRYMDEAALKEDLPGYAEKIETELKRAEERFQAALGYKGDMYDAAIGAGQVEFERAKLAANYLVEPVRLPPVQEGQTRPQEEYLSMQQEATVKNQQAALKSVKAESIKLSDKHFDSAVSWYEKAISFLPEEERAKPVKQQIQAPDGEDDINFYAQSLVLWGNLLYEKSQLHAAVGVDGWQPMVDQAVKNFVEAGCLPSDIKSALKNHVKGSDIKAPAVLEEKEAELAAASSKAASPSEADAEKVKGLPSLGPKPKSKKADAQSSTSKA